MTDLVTAAATVADALRSPGTRDAALDALEALPPPIADDVALAAAPALVDVMARVAEESDRTALDRAALLLARLLAEASPEAAPVYGAAVRGERYAAFIAPSLVTKALQRASSGGESLTRADALSYAYIQAHYQPTYVRGFKVPMAAAGRSVLEYLDIVSFLSPRRSFRLLRAQSLCCAAHPHFRASVALVSG
eukprot:COSAG06_NODE_119_length_23111_cov_51.658613_25_plen_193_part_00